MQVKKENAAIMDMEDCTSIKDQNQDSRSFRPDV